VEHPSQTLWIGDYVFDFGGSNDYINVGDVTYLDGASELTLSAWVKPTSHSGNILDAILSKDGPTRGFHLGLATGNKFRFLVSTTGTTVDVFNSNASYTNGKWYYLAATWDGSNMKIYINGSEDNSITTTNATGTLQNNANPFEIGENGNYAGPLDGFLSNAQIWDKALSGPEVETLYNYGSPITTLANTPQSSNLKAWYKLDASEVYNSSTTEWTINNATSGYTKAFDFELNTASSADEYISIFPNNELNGLTDVTFAGWFYARGTNVYDGIYSNRSSGGYVLIYPDYVTSNTFRLRAAIQASGVTSYVNSNYVSINQWYHFAVVCESGSVLKVYINGQEETNTSGNNFSSIAQSTFFKIGSDSWFRNWNGFFSNFQVWDTGLSSTDAQTLYNNGSPLQNLNDIPQNSNLKAWWKLDASATYDSSTTTWTIPDDSNNSNVGTSNAMTQANLVNSNVSTLNGESSGMSQANLVQSD